MGGKFQRTTTEVEPQAEVLATGPARAGADRQASQQRLGNRATSHMLAARAGALPPALQSGLCRLSGLDLSDVQVHFGSGEPARLGAHAFARGREIHVAPGQERHVAHEAWHLVQQRQGRVSPTTTAAAVRVNDDPELEREADEMGARAAAGGHDAGHATPRSEVSCAPVAQLKSTLTPTPRESGAATPLAALSAAFASYFTKAGAIEAYTFHNLSNIRPSDAGYAGSFDRAGSVVAHIDPASQSKADSKNRDNSVIGPYGHFGVMERAIFGRQNLQNTYDGGHLVEHTLMEARDADVHGNLAPQENKNFNQGLMRGWEELAERMMHSGREFTYSVRVSYSSDTYTRTGKDLLAAGVLDASLPGILDTATAATLDAHTVTLPRWVPYRWDALIDAGTGALVPSMSLTKGEHFRSLEASETAAEGAVVDSSYTSPADRGALRRQNSATLGGYLETAALIGSNTLQVGNQQTIRAAMFQPEPQDLLDQPTATATLSGKAPAVLPAFTGKIKVLGKPISLSRLAKDLLTVSPYKAGPATKLKATATVDREAKRVSQDYMILRSSWLREAEEGRSFVVALYNLASTLSVFDLAAFDMVARRTRLSKWAENRYFALLKDKYLMP